MCHTASGMSICAIKGYSSLNSAIEMWSLLPGETRVLGSDIADSLKNDSLPLP